MDCYQLRCSQPLSFFRPFLQQYVAFIYWVKQVALIVMPKGLALWLFSIPALVYFPVRILMSIAIGWWAFKKVESMNVKLSS